MRTAVITTGTKEFETVSWSLEILELAAFR
jgi:hypothetical protein